MRFKLLLMVLGGFLIYLANQEWQLRGIASPEPQSLGFDELVLNGYGDNAHIQLSDFFLCQGGYVVLEKEGVWQEAFIPVISIQDESVQDLFRNLAELNEEDWNEIDFPAPDAFSLILKSRKIASESDIERLAAADFISGMIINRVESIDSETRNLLEEAYPSTQFENVMIFEWQRKPSSLKGVLIRLTFGLLLMIWPVFSFISGFRRNDETYVANA